MTSQHVAVAPAPLVAREPSVFARFPAWIVQTVWRGKWHLTPLVGGALVFLFGYGAPVGTAAAVGLISATALAASKARRRERMWLSREERQILAVWTAAACAWATVGAFHTFPAGWSAGILAAAVAVPTWQWVTHRVVRKGKLDKDARRLVEMWGLYAACAGRESPHRGSTVVPGSVRTTSTGGTVLDVQLAVHAENATTETARRDVEFFYKFPLGTVALSTIRDDSGRIRVAFNPRREMEAVEGIPYERPRIDPDGRIPIAITPRGEKVGPRAFDADGVKHMWINGGTGAGKSTTAAVVLLPPVLNGHEILIYLDGKGGTSLSEELAPIMTVIAETPDEWRQAIRAFGALIDSRQNSRKRITRWRGKDVEPYPAVRLVIEEAPDVAAAIGTTEHDIVTRAGRAGRALGLATTQISQGTNADQLVGGRPWRANASQVLVHRPGDSLDGNKATNGSNDLRVDPMKLPSGPGWVAILDHGDTWMPARVAFASPEDIAEHTAGFTPRELTGTDLEAVRAQQEDDRARSGADQEPEETPTASEASRARLRALITAHDGAIKIGLLAPSDASRPHTECDTDGCPGWNLGRRQTLTHLNALLASGALTKENGTWTLAPSSQPSR